MFCSVDQNELHFVCCDIIIEVTWDVWHLYCILNLLSDVMHSSFQFRMESLLQLRCHLLSICFQMISNLQCSRSLLLFLRSRKEEELLLVRNKHFLSKFYYFLPDVCLAWQGRHKYIKPKKRKNQSKNDFFCVTDSLIKCNKVSKRKWNWDWP